MMVGFRSTPFQLEHFTFQTSENYWAAARTWHVAVRTRMQYVFDREQYPDDYHGRQINIDTIVREITTCNSGPCSKFVGSPIVSHPDMTIAYTHLNTTLPAVQVFRKMPPKLIDQVVSRNESVNVELLIKYFDLGMGSQT